MTRRKNFTLIALAGIALLGMQSLQAQLTTATLSGTVADTTGAVIPGVSVSVLQVETGTSRDAVTDDEGRYRVPLLDPGEYEIQAELTGFRTAVRTGITLTVGDRVVVDLTLSVGEISERVVVEGEAPLVQTTDTTLSGLVDTKKIRDLPLNGRSFEQLALLQTGVTVVRHTLAGSVSGTGLKFSVAGSRPGSNNFMLDGMNINDAAGATPGSAAGNNLGVESIREFKVLTNTYSAAYGRNTGGVVNIVTKSGTNQWHGSVFEFHRNSALDARNFFDRDPENPLERSDPPSFKRNQFGFTLGGPIKEDSTFIFGSYEGLREGLGLSNAAIVPNAAARPDSSGNAMLPEFDSNGLPTGGTIIVPVDPLIPTYLDFYPLPNDVDFGDGTGRFLSSPTKITNEDYFSIRFDHQLSDRNSLFARYSFQEADVIEPDSLEVFDTLFQSRSQSLVVEAKTIVSPTFINTLRFGGSRSFLERGSDDINGSPPPWIPGHDFGKIQFGTAGGASLAAITNLGTANPELFPYTSQTYSDDINWTRGSHGIQAGVAITRIQNNATVFGTGFNGQYLFDNLEEFLRARAARFESEAPGSNGRFGWRQTFVGLYIQDDFRFSPTLTFNLGFRLEWVNQITESGGRQAALLDLSDPAYTVGAPLFDQTSPQYQPRIGIAWDPFGNGKTAIRAGAGIFHDQLLGFWYNLAASNLNPFVVNGNVGPPVPFPDAFDSVAGGTPTVLSLEPQPNVPTKIQYNFNIEQELFPNTVLTVAYVGSRGTFLPRAAGANTSVPVILDDGSKFWPVPWFVTGRRNPDFFLMVDTKNDVNSFYNALQVSLNRRFSNSLQYQFAYNYSHSIDDGSQQLGSEAQNAPMNHTQHDNRKADRSHSTFDLRHNFTANASYDLPFGAGQSYGSGTSGLASKLISGWQVNTIISVANGTPRTIQVGYNNTTNGDFLQPERPDLVPGMSNSPIEGSTEGCGTIAAGTPLGTPDLYFDPCAFTLPQRGTFGDLARSSVIGPGYANVDLAFTKDTTFGDSAVNVQFRAEFFNIFNRTNFDLPDPIMFLANPNPFLPGTRRGAAGTISRTITTSRQIQFALKIIF